MFKVDTDYDDPFRVTNIQLCQLLTGIKGLVS